MQAKDPLRNTLEASDFLIKTYLNDLTDDQLKMIPVEGMNPIALQMGHLINAERHFVEMVKPGASPALPEGFAEKHDLKQGAKDDGSRYSTKAQYLALWDAQRAATVKALESFTDEDLGKPSPQAFRMFQTVGALFNLIGIHAIGHSGQFVAVRRKLELPIAF